MSDDVEQGTGDIQQGIRDIEQETDDVEKEINTVEEEMGNVKKRNRCVLRNGREGVPLVMFLNMGINHQVPLFFTLRKD